MRKMVQSIVFRLAIPIPLFFLLCMGIAWVAIPRILENSAIAAATTSATDLAIQIKKIREYYTKNVIADVEASSDLSVGIEHETDPITIPLPATFIHDLSRLISDRNISLALYSDYPFPDRSTRQMDSFMKESWAYLIENPDGTYKRQAIENGANYLRVAVADRMVAEVCVSCHNSHPDSPKTDWNMGDVRGVIEVRKNIQTPLDVANILTQNILLGVTLGGFGLLVIVWLTSRTITRPITKIRDSMETLIEGNLDTEFPIATRSDELGQIGRALVKLKHDLKQSQDSAMDRTKQMAALLGALPDSYFRIDQNGQILDYRVRPGAGPVDDPVSFLGRNMAEVFPPSPLALFEENMRKQQGTGEVVTWEYHLEFDGKRRDREAHLCPISGTDELVLVVRDISTRREAERITARVQARLERIIGNLPGAVFSRRITKSEGATTVYVSPQCTGIWGYTPEEVYATHGILETTVDRDDFIRMTRLFSKSIDNLESYTSRYQITSRSGERKWLETHTSAYMEEEGVTRTVGFVTDVTADVKIQQQLEEQQKLAERSQKLDSIGQLTGGVAHDFNNLLAAIMGNLELLRDDEADDEHLSLIDAGINATQRGAELTRSMLAFARRASLDPSIIDLNSIVDETRNWTERTLPSSIYVRTSLMPGLWPIKADISSTESALLNLIVNARDAMPEGGELSIETSNVNLGDGNVDARHEKMEPGRYVVLSVSDAGHGIPSDKLDHIFEPFFSTKAPNAGTGLGLSMVLGFMEQSGGTIQVFSEPNVGTTFKLFFKASTEEIPTAEAKTRKSQNLRGDHQKILVAEDDKAILPILVKILKKAGYGVTAATSGDEALELFEADPTIDLLLTDIMMPGSLQGIALSGAIRERAPDLPVIFMSGYASEETTKGEGLRPDDIRLLKPVRRADLLAAIKSSLEG